MTADLPLPRQLRRSDATAVWRLIRETADLDQNSPYLYLMLGTYFTETCAVLDAPGGGLAGVLTGFRPPEDPGLLFVWQLAVAEEHRGRGVARSLLDHVLSRHPDVDAVGATIAPTNAASQGVFLGLARDRGWHVAVEPFLLGSEMPAEAGEHDDESLFLVTRPGRGHSK